MAEQYPYDINGILESNHIKNELQTFPSAGSRGFSLIAPFKAPFHKTGLEIRLTDGTLLRDGIDYELGWYYEELSSKAGASEIFMAILLRNQTYIAKQVVLKYFTVGAEYVMDKAPWVSYVANSTINPAASIWDTMPDRPDQYSSNPNLVNLDKAVGWDKMVGKLKELIDESTISYSRIKTMIDLHVHNEVNAHEIDLDILGLSQFKNFAKATMKTLEDGVDESRYIAVSELRQFLGNHYVQKVGTTAISLNGPKEAYQGSDINWVITDFDSFSEYRVEADFLNAVVENNVIKLSVPDNAGIGETVINVFKNGVARKIKLLVKGVGVLAPSIIGVLDGQSNVVTNLQFSLSTFVTEPAGIDTFKLAQYEISTTDTFSNIIESGETTVTNAIKVTLPPRTRLHMRVRHVGNSNLASNWSTPISFVTGDTTVDTTPPSIGKNGFTDIVSVTRDSDTNEVINARADIKFSLSQLTELLNNDWHVEFVRNGVDTRTVTNTEFRSLYQSEGAQGMIDTNWKLNYTAGPRTGEFKMRFVRIVNGTSIYGQWGASAFYDISNSMP